MPPQHSSPPSAGSPLPDDSRLAVLRPKAWQDYALGPDTRLDVQLVERRIIITRSTGRSSEDSTRQYFYALNQVIDEYIAPEQDFALVQDWSGLTGASLGARAVYISKIRGLPHLGALIFTGLSAKFQMSIRLARRFRPVSYPVIISHNLDEGIQAAIAALGIDAVVDRTGGARRATPTFPWSVKRDNFEIYAQVIENDIFHTVNHGQLKQEYVDDVTALRQRVMADEGLEDGFSGIIADVSRLEGTTRKARRKYMQSMLSWHRKYPLGAMVYYGANRLIRAGVTLARPFMPFHLRVVDTLEEAIAIVKSHPPQRHSRRIYRGAAVPACPEAAASDTGRYARQIVDYLAAIQWEEDGIRTPPPVGANHPFADVFDAIALIKGELDDLFRERRLAETEKKQLYLQLRQAHKMESIGTLAGGISHDFNNILAIIQGNVEMALDEAPESHPLNPYLQEIQTACKRGTEVVSQLLHFARDNDPEKHTINLSGIIRESLNLMRATTPASIQITTDLPESPVVVRALPTQIHQMMINMCTNAAHAMEDTGGILTVSLRRTDSPPDAVRLPRHLRNRPLAELVITDTGQGIDAEIMERIFDPYFTTKPVGRGTGLGLSVVHGIIASHGGHIHATSRIGGPTRFTIWLPLSAEAASVPVPGTSELPRGSERILVVDDEISLVRLIAQMLSKLGYRVDAHTAPDTALRAFKTAPGKYALVLTDMEMPGMTGVVLAERMWQVRENIPIIMCTGFSQIFTADDAFKNGFTGYLLKPVDRQEMASCIRKAIDDAAPATAVH